MTQPDKENCAMPPPNNPGHCCTRCQFYWTCDTKWYRGERNEEHICCPRCDFFTVCAKSKEE